MATHIFSTVEEIQEHYPFLATVKYEKLLPSIKFVERRYVPELLDAVTWGTLLDEIDDLALANVKWQLLAEYTRDAFAFLTAMHYVPHANVQIGQNGLLVNVSDSTVPASKDRKNDLLRGINTQAVDALDYVVGYMNDNTVFFTDYASSDLYDASKASLINTAKDFNDLYPVGTNRWVWRLLKPWRNKAEQSRIIGTLGEDYYNELIAEAKTGTLTAANQKIYNQARQALAFATVELSMLNMSIAMDENAITVFSNIPQMAQELRSTAEIQRIELAAKNAKRESDRLLSQIEKELTTNASATVYATYFASDSYTAPDELPELNKKEDDNPYFNAL